MKGIFKKDSTIKIVAIFFAMLMWFVVMDNENPIISTDVSVPLKLEHEDSLIEKGLSIKNKNFPQNVSVTIKGRKDKLHSMNSNDIEALIDLSQIDIPGNKELFVRLSFKNEGIPKDGVSFEGVSPKITQLEIERIGENSFPVEVVIQGKMKEKYKIIKSSTVPEIISIHDSDSIVKSIGAVKVFFDVTDLDKNVDAKKSCKVYNKSGKEIIDLENNYSVNLKLEIAKEVVIVPSIKGTPDKNFIEGFPSVTPNKALIIGEQEVVGKVSELKTETIDIQGARNDIQRSCSLILPHGVKLFEPQNNVSINVKIEPLARKEFLLTKNEIIMLNTDVNNYKYNVLSEGIAIIITGNKVELDNLERKELKSSIDAKGLGEGIHKLPLKLIIPSTVRLLKEPEVEFEIIKK